MIKNVPRPVVGSRYRSKPGRGLRRTVRVLLVGDTHAVCEKECGARTMIGWLCLARDYKRLPK